MEPLLMIVLPGVLGGVVLALVLARLGGSPERPPAVGRLEPPSTSIINMARIRVTGVGDSVGAFKRDTPFAPTR